MHTRWSLLRCEPETAERMRAAWPRAAERLAPLVGEEGTLHLFAAGGAVAFRARAVLTLPTGLFVAESQNPDLSATLPELVDTLRRRLLGKPVGHALTGAGEATRLLEEDLARGDRAAFFALTRALLEPLREHVRRELRILEIREGAASEGLRVEDLLDAAVLRAWGELDLRPPEQPFESWLLELLHHTIDETALAPEESSLDEPVADLDPYSDESEWRDILLEHEAPTLQRTLAGQAELRQALGMTPVEPPLVRALSELPDDQRRAFELFAYEGFDVALIALAQRRREEDVRDDIDAAAGALGLRPGEELPEQP